MSEQYYDVVAVNMDSNKVRIFATKKSKNIAEILVSMSVMRRGVETEFFSGVPHGKYNDGDTWRTK